MLVELPLGNESVAKSTCCLTLKSGDSDRTQVVKYEERQVGISVMNGNLVRLTSISRNIYTPYSEDQPWFLHFVPSNQGETDEHRTYR